MTPSSSGTGATLEPLTADMCSCQNGDENEVRHIKRYNLHKNHFKLHTQIENVILEHSIRGRLEKKNCSV